jgi:hypothetical protein
MERGRKNFHGKFEFAKLNSQHRNNFVIKTYFITLIYKIFYNY